MYGLSKTLLSWTEWTETNHKGWNMTKLKVDEAYLNVVNFKESRFALYWRTNECINCLFKKLYEISAAIPPPTTEEPTTTTESAPELIQEVEPIKSVEDFHLEISRKIELMLYKYVEPSNQTKIDNEEDSVFPKYLFPNQTENLIKLNNQPDFGAFGVYQMQIQDEASFTTIKDPVNIYFSIAYVAVILIAFYWICKQVNRIFLKQDEPVSNDEAIVVENEVKIKKRLQAIDIFRGVAIVMMIFVNSGGGHYWWIEHATWNGLHVADVVFPFFLFIMGTCIPMSIRSQMNQQKTKSQIVFRIAKRSITLFLFGIFINTVWGATFETIRIPGVLQRFGIAYFVISFIHVALYRYIANAENTFERVFADLRMIFRQWLVILFITIVYVAIIFTFHVPGCGRAYFGPGGIHDLGTHANCTGGVTGYIDRQFFGIEHMYNHARIRKVYDALVFDPEGLFGCLTTFLQVFLGVQSGMIFLTFPNPSDRIARFLSWGTTLLVITFGLTIGTWTQGIIPINKNLWSLSFVTLTSGFAFFLLALIYFIADVRKLGDDFWTIFLYPGMNAIILYLGHSILNRMWPFHFSFDVMNTHFILLLENCYTTVIWILISHFLFRKKMFYSV